MRDVVGIRALIEQVFAGVVPIIPGRLFERGALILGVGKKARRAEIIRGTYHGKISSKGDPYSRALEGKPQ